MRWGYHLKDLVRWVSRGELDRLGARGKAIGADTVRLFGELYRDDLSNEEAACLYWYMRNRLYFDLGLHMDPRVLLVQYEDAVLNRDEAFRRILGFLGLPFDPLVVKSVFSSSVGRSPWLGVDPAIREACDALKANLDAAYVGTAVQAPTERTPVR
jgi:hypothetical protein